MNEAERKARIKAIEVESGKRFPGKSDAARKARFAFRNAERAKLGLGKEKKKRGGAAGVWDRNKDVIVPVGSFALGMIPGVNLAVPALAAAAARGLDREGKSGIGFDVGNAAKGAIEGGLAGGAGSAVGAGIRGAQAGGAMAGVRAGATRAGAIARGAVSKTQALNTSAKAATGMGLKDLGVGAYGVYSAVQGQRAAKDANNRANEMYAKEAEGMNTANTALNNLLTQTTEGGDRSAVMERIKKRREEAGSRQTADLSSLGDPRALRFGGR
jgi:hypothetical protein